MYACATQLIWAFAEQTSKPHSKSGFQPRLYHLGKSSPLYLSYPNCKRSSDYYYQQISNRRALAKSQVTHFIEYGC